LFASELAMQPYLAIVFVAFAGLIVGMLIYSVAIHRVINAPHLSTLLATFAVNMIIIGLATAQFSTTPRNIDMNLGSVDVGPFTLQWTRIIAALAAILVTAALYLFLYRTKPGK